jgi:thioredoxin-like negative regulator of GroEL
LSWNKKNPEALELFGQLARAAPADKELRVRLAEVTLWSGDHDKALDLYYELLAVDFDAKLWPAFTAAASAKRLDGRYVPIILRIYDETGATDTKDAVFLARLAWTLQRLKETDRSRVVLDRALALRPEEPAARKELAGVLAAAGNVKEALAMYEGVPLELSDRYQLAWMYAAQKDFPAAEEQCRAILKEKPEDKKALRQLADVMSWNKEYPQALALFKKLAAADPGDVELPVRLAEVTLWSGAYGEALALYQTLLAAHFDRAELWPGFVDAAASAPALTKETTRLSEGIYQRITKAESTDVAFLTRLAWVMHRLKEPEKSSALLDRALAQAPSEPALRKELAGVLGAAGRNKEALRLYDAMPLALADRYQLASLYAADKDFYAAELQCRAILKEQPEDQKARRQLADILSWNKDYPASLALLEKLATENPKDVEVLRRLAEVTLWSGAYDKAVARFQTLVAEHLDRRELWPGFVDAAASASQLSDETARLLRRIGDRAVSSEKDVTFLTRLSWALHRLKDAGKVGQLLDRALALNTSDPAVRKELAGVLAAAGRSKDALKVYQGLPLDLQDPFQLASLHAADKDFQAAELQCRAVLAKMPDDTKATRLLAAILTWKKDFAQALPLLRKLAEADPSDSDAAVRLAEVTL